MFQQHNFESSSSAPELAMLKTELRAIARQLHAALAERPAALPGTDAVRASMARIRGETA